MIESRDDILHPGQEPADEEFPFAPPGWTPDLARRAAEGYDIELVDDHWGVIRGLQEYYARREGGVNVRELLDALNEKFHGKGGLKYLYRLLPGGPVAQGCRLAGLQPPAGAVDKGFGSVQ
jgi:TusE/DsrC/DsvC family sulfur relay protein